MKSDSLKAKQKETRVFKTFVLQHWLSDLGSCFIISNNSNSELTKSQANVIL